MHTTNWIDVPLYWLDTARELDDAERIAALAEYRATGGMHLVIMAEPTGDDSTDEYLCYEGPAVGEIDWTGFPEESLMAHDTSIFQGWTELGEYRAEDLGGGTFAVYRRLGDRGGQAYVRVTTICAANGRHAIRRFLDGEGDDS